MPARHDADPSGEEIAVRPSTPADRADVEHLITHGVLPGHVDYESRHADRIRQSFGSDRERFLVAQSTADGRIIGTLAVVEANPDVGHLHWLRVEPAWQADSRIVARKLIKTATQHARDVGLLKLVMHAPTHLERRVISYYEQLGFEFSRARDPDGVHVLEFYLNLYQRPTLRDD